MLPVTLLISLVVLGEAAATIGIFSIYHNFISLLRDLHFAMLYHYHFLSRLLLHYIFKTFVALSLN